MCRAAIWLDEILFFCATNFTSWLTYVGRMPAVCARQESRGFLDRKERRGLLEIKEQKALWEKRCCTINLRKWWFDKETVNIQYLSKYNTLQCVIFVWFSCFVAYLNRGIQESEVLWVTLGRKAQRYTRNQPHFIPLNRTAVNENPANQQQKKLQNQSHCLFEYLIRMWFTSASNLNKLPEGSSLEAWPSVVHHLNIILYTLPE